MPPVEDSDQNRGGLPGVPKRRKIALACDACKARKKRCDGRGPPCGLCAHLEEPSCVYTASDKKKRSLASELNRDRDSSTRTENATQNTGSEDASEAESPTVASVTANSGTLFLSVIDAVQGNKNRPDKPQRTIFYGWNLGLRPTNPSEGFAQSVFRLVSTTRLESFIDAFFRTVNPFYDLLNRQEVSQWCLKRQEIGNNTADPQLDSVLCCLAALGSLFSGSENVHLEESLILNAKLCLNSTIEEEPTPLIVLAWLLRAIYSRSAESAQAAWMASCSSVRLAEAIGLYSDDWKQKQHDNGNCPPRVSSKIFQSLSWIPTVLNTSMAYELGRGRVHAKELPSHWLKQVKSHSDHGAVATMTEAVLLHRCFDTLDPQRPLEIPEIDALFEKLTNIKVSSDAIRLSKCILSLATFRRRLMAGSNIPAEMKRQMIEEGAQSLDSIDRLLVTSQPWWNLSQLPIQLLCVLLVMDTPASLSLVDRTMRVLRAVVAKYDTVATREALAFACSTVRSALDRKDSDRQKLQAALSYDPSREDAEEKPRGTNDNTNGVQGLLTASTNNLPTDDISFLQDQDFDWNTFLYTGTAAFDNILTTL